MTAPRDALAEAVFVALGSASACWENLGGAGVFDSDRCAEIGHELVAWLAEQYAAQRAEGAREALAEVERRSYKVYADWQDLAKDRPDLNAWLSLVRKVAAEQGGYDHSKDVPPHTHGGTDAPECTICAPVERGGEGRGGRGLAQEPEGRIMGVEHGPWPTLGGA